MPERPESAEAFAALLSSGGPWQFANDPVWDLPGLEGEQIELSGWTGVTEFSPEDMVVSVRSGTRIADLQEELASAGRRLPLGATPMCEPNPTLAQAIGFALPHTLEGAFGSWREWVLGMTVVLGDGTLAKSGSKVVKSVAGYDAHKLFIGARGAFGLILDVHLRVWPAGPEPVHVVGEGDERPWVQRTLRTDFEAAMDSAGSSLVHADPETATLWAASDDPLQRFAGDWVVRGLPGELEFSADEAPFLAKAKRLLDPHGRCNPGALGLC